MILRFTFRRMAPVPLLERVLKEILEKSALKFHITLAHQALYLWVSGDSKRLLALAEELSCGLPLSLLFVFEKLEVIEEESSWPQGEGFTLAQNPQDPMEFTQKELESFWMSENAIRPLPWPFSLKARDQELAPTTPEAFYQALSSLVEILLQGEVIVFATRRGLRTLALTNVKDAHTTTMKDLCIMPCDLAAAEMIFRASKEELQALATLEKPRIALPFKGIFSEDFARLQEGEESTLDVVLPYDLGLTLLATLLRKAGVEAILLGEVVSAELFSSGLYYEVPFKLESPKIVVGDSSRVLFLEGFSSGSKVATEYSALLEQMIEEHALISKRSLALHLDSETPTHLWMLREEEIRNILRFTFDLNPANALAAIENSGEVAARLVENFLYHFPECGERIRLCAGGPERFSENLMDWLGVTAFILGMVKTPDACAGMRELLRLAQACVSGKGPRVDFRLENRNGALVFDSLAVIRSSMSFKIAGVEPEILAFGIVDSLAEFLANLLRDMEENFGEKNLLLTGSLLAYRPFLHQFLHYLSSKITLHLPFSSPLTFQS